MRLQTLRAVLFDLDGVLIDSYEVWRHVMNAVAAELGYPEIPREVFHASWGQGIEADQRRFFPRHGIDEIEARYEARFPEHLGHLRVAEEVPDVFARLELLAIPSAVVTNTPAPLARTLVARARARPDALVGGTDVPRPKPAPDMLRRACELLDVPPEAALLVGDSRYDREAARAAGVPFAGLGIPGDLALDSLGGLLGLLPEAPARADER
jgi:phosphoglycolate phosphatase/AHBA synthesis associated protein